MKHIETRRRSQESALRRETHERCAVTCLHSAARAPGRERVRYIQMAAGRLARVLRMTGETFPTMATRLRLTPRDIGVLFDAPSHNRDYLMSRGMTKINDDRPNPLTVDQGSVMVSTRNL